MSWFSRSRPNRLAFALCSLGLSAGCTQQAPTKVPGETELEVARVLITPKPASAEVSMTVLLPKLGSRPSNALYSSRLYNPFRVAEDRRRIYSFLATQGYLDAVVDEPVVQLNDKQASIAFSYTSGAHYTLVSVAFKGVPEEVDLAPFRKAEPLGEFDLEAMRVARYDMAAELQRHGFGHARVYVRFYIDRTKHEVSAVYFGDPGPRTRIGKLTVEGARNVAAEDILARTGLKPEAPFSLAAKETAEADLYDTGAFAQVSLTSTADVEQYFGDLPDTGGVLDATRIGTDGELLPRALSETIDVVIHVDEAPRAKLSVRAGAELDPNRLDLHVGAGAELRNLLGSQHHVTVRGRIGFGYVWREEDPFGLAPIEQPAGLYGDALLRYVRPSLLGRILDGRFSARYRDQLYPGFHLREFSVGPGVRSTLSKGVFLDADAMFRAAGQIDFGSFTEADRARYALANSNTYLGGEVSAAVVWDARNDPVEATQGHLLAARALASPFGTQTYVQLAPEARAFLPLGTSFALGVQASGGWVFGYDDRGVPLGPRLFGGGAFGMRGFGRDRLSPVTTVCTDVCRQEYVGGLSLVEAKVELRYLPPQKQAGITVFADLGGVGKRANPFDDGVQMAAGLGPRLRLWYVPISLDVSYRFLQNSELVDGGLRVFARIGESF
jgi:outer membrane protein assembly factor BamA